MLALGMLARRAFSRTMARVAFMAGSVPERAAMAIWLPILVKRAPRLASVTAFCLFVVAHLLCPDIVFSFFDRIACFDFFC